MLSDLQRYHDTKEYLESCDDCYLQRRKKQLTGIITRAAIEKDMIDNELNERKTKVTDGISKENQA